MYRALESADLVKGAMTRSVERFWMDELVDGLIYLSFGFVGFPLLLLSSPIVESDCLALKLITTLCLYIYTQNICLITSSMLVHPRI